MKRKTSVLPKVTLGRLMGDAGAARISDSAIDVIQEHLLNHAEQVVQSATALAKHAGRRTIVGKDIVFASNHSS